MGHDQDHKLDCTTNHAACTDCGDFDASAAKHGLMSKVDKIKLDALVNLSLGSWTDEDSDSDTLVKDAVYKVTSDGFVVALNGINSWARFYTDSSNPPTTEVLNNFGFDSTVSGGFTVPVKSGDYWKVTETYGNITAIRWLPIGSGECEIQV